VKKSTYYCCLVKVFRGLVAIGTELLKIDFFRAMSALFYSFFSLWRKFSSFSGCVEFIQLSGFWQVA